MSKNELKSMRPSRCTHCVELEAANAALRSQLQELKEALAAAARAGKRQASPFGRGQRKKNPKKPGRKPGHPGAKREKPDRVDQTLVAAPLDVCPDCGGPLEDERPEENYQTDIPPVEPEVTRFVFASWWCASCGRRIYSMHPYQTSTATGAAASHLGPRVRALVADFKCRLGMPFRKIQDVLKHQFGIEVSPGAMVASNYRLANQAQPTLKALKDALSQEEVVHADETGWRVWVQSYWLWVVCSKSFTFYEIVPHRCATVVREILGEDFEGWLMRDGWSSYDARLDCRMLRCLGHLLHNAEKLEDSQEGEAAETIALFILWLHGVFSLKKQVEELSAEEYQQEADAMVEWLDEFLQESNCSSESNQKFANQLTKIRPQIIPILEHAELPATNNQGERQIRPAVIHRKVCAGNKTERGAKTLADLASLAATSRQQLADFASVVFRILTAPVDQAVIFWQPVKSDLATT
jgi:transposase